jgi:hypothetical protein
MERSEILTSMAELKLYGMKAAFDEIIGTAVKRQHEPQRIVGDLLTAEITEKQARSIRYQITIARLPLAKDIGDFTFDDTPINQTLVRDLAGGNFLAHQRNAVLAGGTGAGNTHLPLPSRAPASAMPHVDGSSTLSTWSTSLKPRHARAGSGAWPTISAGWTSSFSTSSATCRSPNPVASCCSI